MTNHAFPQTSSAAQPVMAPISRQFVGRVIARSWWIVAVAVVLGVVLGVIEVKRAAPVYQADVLVVASSTTVTTANFGALATATFQTDTVIDPVIRRLRLNTTTQRLLRRHELSIQTLTNAPAVHVVGRADSPDLATRLANEAAQSFVTVATANTLGKFSVFGSAAPGSRVPVSTSSGVRRGAAAGLLLGVLLVILLFLWRKPIYSQDDVAVELGVDAAFVARARPSPPRWLPVRRRSYDVFPRGTALAVWRVVDAIGSDERPSRSCVILVERRRGGDPALLAVMEDVITTYWATSNGQQPRQPLEWKRPSDPDLPKLLTGASVVVALVSEGASRRALRQLDEELRLFRDDKSRVAVLIR